MHLQVEQVNDIRLHETIKSGETTDHDSLAAMSKNQYSCEAVNLRQT